MHRFAVPLTAVITAASLTLAAGTTQSSDRTPTPIESASHSLPDAAVTTPVTIPLAAFDAGRDASQIDTITLDTSSVDPDRASVGLVPARVETNAATGARVMTGGLSGEPGRFVLAEVGGTIAGAVWTDDGAYDIRPVGDEGRVRLIRIDAINLPACATVGDAPRSTRSRSSNRAGSGAPTTPAAGRKTSSASSSASPRPGRPRWAGPTAQTPSPTPPSPPATSPTTTARCP